MKRSTIVSLLLIGLVSFATVGCKKKGVDITPIPGKKPAISGPGAGGLENAPGYNPGQDTAGFIETTPSGLSQSSKTMNPDPAAQRREVLQAETIYFDLDSSTIKSSEQSKLKAVADYMAANPTHDVLIEGHCDERGTEGYNQSLGERRALAAREYLASIGAPADRIFTTSFGETRPAAQGGGEESWSKNRRGEFVVVLPAGQ